MRVWRGEESSGDTHHNFQDIPGERCTAVRFEHSASSRTSGDHEQDYLRNHTRIEAQHRATQQEASRQGRRLLEKQIWMVMEARSKPWDIKKREKRLRGGGARKMG